MEAVLFVAFESYGKCLMLVGIFGTVMCANSLMEFFFFDGGCSWKVTGPKKEVVVVEMVVGEGGGDWGRG